MNTTTIRPEAKAAETALAAAMAAPELEAGPGGDPLAEIWADAQARTAPNALSAAWHYGRAVAGEADAWTVARARLDAVYAIRAAWEAQVPEDEDDDRTFPGAIRDEVRAAEAALLEARAPHWQGVADKARFLLPWLDDGVWEPDWTPNPAARGMVGALARVIIVCEALGQDRPKRIEALVAGIAAEELALEACVASDGYRNYAVNPGCVADIANIVSAIQEDARELNRRPGYEGLGVGALQAVWFDRDDDQPQGIAEPVERGDGPDLRPQLEAMGALRPRLEQAVQ